MEIAGEAANVAAGIEASARLRPDVVLLDIRLPDGSGITAKILNHAAAPRFADGEVASLGWHIADCHAFRTN